MNARVQKRKGTGKHEGERGWRNEKEIAPSRLDQHEEERNSFGRERERRAKQSKAYMPPMIRLTARLVVELSV